MFILQAAHPSIPGTVLKLFHTREAAEREALACLRIIGDYLAKDYRACYGAEHHNAADWEELRDDPETALFTMSEFLIGFDTQDADEQEWFLEVREQQPVDADAVNEVISEELAGGGVSLSAFSDIATDRIEIPLIGPGDKLEYIQARQFFADYDTTVAKNRQTMLDAAIGRRDHVQPLDPADLVVSTLVQNLANIIAHPEACYKQGADWSDAVGRMVKEAETAMEAGQAWLDKARPIGRIAADVVRLAGIIVAGTDLHACLSEAMDQHIYDESNGEEPDEDCGYTAALKGWTDALAGITVTTPAPAAPVYDVPEIAIIMEGGLVQNIVARNSAPVIAHIVDYDIEGGDETDIVEIPQGEGKTAGAFLQCYDGKLDRSASAAFWTALKQ